MVQYDEEELRFMLKCGTAPSAGGARAPISEMISHVSRDIKRRFWGHECDRRSYLEVLYKCLNYISLVEL